VKHRLVRAADVTPQPWRNGGGATRELLAWPRAEGWRVRVSVAAIDRDGPFSAFPGVVRWFAVVDGAGVELTIGERTQRLRRAGPPVSFRGEAETYCRLIDGPTQGLNLMLSGVAGAMVLAADGRAHRVARNSACGLFSAVAGRCGDIEVPPRALLWFDEAPATLTFVAGERTQEPIGWWLTAAAAGGAR
jgi:environmental stress-induced protein Ves